MNRETLEERMHLRESLAQTKEIIQMAAKSCYSAGRLDSILKIPPGVPRADSEIPESTLKLLDYFVEVAETLDERLAYSERRLNELQTVVENLRG